jgi:hypothetical protein
MPSVFSRLGQALRYVAFGSKEERGIPGPDALWYRGFGVPNLFKPKESLEAHNNNVWLRGAVNKIAETAERHDHAHDFGDGLELDFDW